MTSSTIDLTFDRSQKLLSTSDGQSWPADNIPESGHAPWPAGTFNFVQRVTHAGDGPESPYGSYGGLLFDVPGRIGLEIHSGRAHSRDLAGRSGIEHCTLGCIRTTDEALSVLITLQIGTLTVP